jgi:hypothetical protein
MLYDAVICSGIIVNVDTILTSQGHILEANGKLFTSFEMAFFFF